MHKFIFEILIFLLHTFYFKVRLHTSRIQNQPPAQNAISLTNSETQILHFETRLRQLDCAMELEMYNVSSLVHCLLNYLYLAFYVSN